MNLSSCHYTKVCGNWYVHNWKSPNNKHTENNMTYTNNDNLVTMNTNNTNHNIRNTSNSNHNMRKSRNNHDMNSNIHISQYNNNINHTGPYIVPRLLAQSNNTTFSINYGNVHNMNSYCFNNRYCPM